MEPKNDVVGQDEKRKQYPFLYLKRAFISQTALGLLGSIVLMMVIGLGMAFAEKIPAETNQKIKGVRIPFIMNQGQTDRQVRFFAKTFSGTVYVTDQGKMVYELPTSKDRKSQGWVLVEEALDSLPVKEIKGEKESDTKVSFFKGNDPAKWKSGLATYETVNLGEVYKGIELKLRAYGGSVEKLYYISPGKEPKEIRIRVNGADSLKVNDQGELEAQTGNGPVVFSRPKAFQQAGIYQENVEVAYFVDKDSYGFKVGSYDKSRKLIIDPLIQSTYLGGNDYDYAYCMAVSGGYVYVAGDTYSSDFPGTSGGAQFALLGNADAFVSRLSADLGTLIQSTYLGGNGGDVAKAIAVSGGNVYVAGGTNSSDFPGTSGGYQQVTGGSTDAFVSRLSADLGTLIQSTYLGGNGGDDAYSIAVSGGNVYVAGPTDSSNFPGTIGGAQPGTGGNTDAYVSLLSADLKQLVQSTYLGGNGYDNAYSLAVSGGNVYVAGWTQSTNFPGTSGGAQPALGGNTDAYVSLLSPDLKTLIQSTYLGGIGDDNAYSLAVSGGNVYVAGDTFSTIFPGTSEGAQSTLGGGKDAYVSLLSPDLKTLIQSTYLGGIGDDNAYSLAVSGGDVYVAGDTFSTIFPGTNGGAQSTLGGGKDAYVSFLSPDLKRLVQSTYLGGVDNDSALSLVVSGGDVYAAGGTYSINFPGTSGGYQTALSGNADAFVSLLRADLKDVLTPNVSTGSATAVTRNSATLNGTVNPYGSSTSYHFEWGSTTAYGNPPTSSQSAGTGTDDVAVSADLTGLNVYTTYHYRLVASNSAGTTYGSDMTFTTSTSSNIDFNNDGKTDIAVWRPGDGNWYILNSTDIPSVTVQQWGQGSLGDIPIPGDYDGDGKTDIAVWRPGEGNWYIRNSATGTVTVQQWGQGSLGDIPVPGDYDGDGKTDIAVWRPGEGNWYIRNSASGTVTVQQWGQPGDIPVPGDYDGDGKTDIAVWRPSEGNWYIRNSGTGTVTVQQWGANSLHDIPVPGDYDGDGKTDMAVWRPGEGNWYIRNSGGGPVTVQQWGQGSLGDIPVPGDYDGDGKTDIAVWRPGEGNWYIRNSATGTVTVQQWGANWLNDIPISTNTIIYRQVKGLLY